MSLRLGADPTLASSMPWRKFAEAEAREANLPSGFAGRAAPGLDEPVCSTQLPEPAQPLPTLTWLWVGSVLDRESSCPPVTHHTHPAPSALPEPGSSKPPNKGNSALGSPDHPFSALTGGKPAPLGKDTAAPPLWWALLYPALTQEVVK